MKRILVIDDDESFRLLVRSTLAMHGFEAAEAASGQEGLALARTWMPDLILSDLYMGDGTGYDLLHQLGEAPNTASIPLVIMSGQGREPEMRHSMELGADDFLQKPFGEHTLLATVQARLKRQDSLRHLAEHTEARLVAILEATPDLVGILDAAYDKIVYLNQAGRAMLGLSSTESLASLRAAAIHPPEVLRRLLESAVPAAVGSGVWSAETVFSDCRGNAIPFSQVIMSQKSDDGRVEYLATVARDISREKETQKQQYLLEVQLRQAQKLESIGQLAAGIAHEINTPTQYIGDNIRFLQTAFQDIGGLLARYDELVQAAQTGLAPVELDRQAREARATADLEYLTIEIPKAIEQTLDGLERVAKIVRAMKEFSHPGTQQKTLTDINHAIDSTLTVARNEWKYVANVETDFDESLPLVPCLPGDFNQVILNLVINAAHAIAEVVGEDEQAKGTIAISTRRAEPWAEIRIRDTGAGIPEKIREKVFDPFFTTKPVGKGTGQGLAIARSVVVDKHGGTIRFESQCGQGTTFIICLPLKETKNNAGKKEL